MMWKIILLLAFSLPPFLEANIDVTFDDFKSFEKLQFGNCDFQKDLPQKLNLHRVIASTLKYQWDIHISEALVQRQAGVAEEFLGPFDPTLDLSFNHTRLHHLQTLGLKSTKDGHINSMGLSLNKLTCPGTLFSLGGSVFQEYNPLLLLSQPFDRTNQVALSFAIDQPLLRRFLYNQECIDAKVSCIDLKAVKWEMIQSISERIRISVRSYWDLIAAKEVLNVRRDSFDRLKRLARSTKKLIEGDQLAASELNQQFAELFRERRARTLAEQNVYRAYNDLRLATGEGLLDAECSCKLNIPDIITEKLPPLETINDDCLIDRLLQKAIENRGDYLAIQWRTVGAGLELKSAYNATLPELDVVLEVNLQNSNVNNQAKPFFRPFGASRPQTNWTAGVTLSIPLYNDSAKGEYRQRNAELKRIFLQEQQLFATIQTNVATALRDYFSLKREMEDADRAVEWYEKTLQDEIKRFKEGYSTLFIVIDFENRLSNVLIERVATYNAFARNLVELYFLTGLLVRPDTDFFSVCLANVASMKDLSE